MRAEKGIQTLVNNFRYYYSFPEFSSGQLVLAFVLYMLAMGLGPLLRFKGLHPIATRVREK